MALVLSQVGDYAQLALDGLTVGKHVTITYKVGDSQWFAYQAFTASAATWSAQHAAPIGQVVSYQVVVREPVPASGSTYQQVGTYLAAVFGGAPTYQQVATENTYSAVKSNPGLFDAGTTWQASITLTTSGDPDPGDPGTPEPPPGDPTFTVTQATGNPPHVVITVFGTNPGDVLTIARSGNQGASWEFVRGGYGIVSTGGTVTLRDWSVPLNTRVFYSVSNRRGSVDIVKHAETTCVSDTAWLQDAVDPATGVPVEFRAVFAEGAGTYMYPSYRQASWQQPVDTVQVLGARLPVTSVGTRSYEGSIPVEIACHTSDADKLRDLFGQAGVLLSRGAPGLHPTQFFVLPDVQEKLLGSSGNHVHIFSGTAISVREPNASIVVPFYTYTDVQQNLAVLGLGGATYDAVLAQTRLGTYADVSSDPMRIGAGIDPGEPPVDPPTPPTTYPLTVSAGSGGTLTGTTSGNYAAGVGISVTAKPDAGMGFTGWTVSGVAISASTNPAAFPMPANPVSLAANFAPATPNPDYQLTTTSLWNGTTIDFTLNPPTLHPFTVVRSGGAINVPTSGASLLSSGSEIPAGSRPTADKEIPLTNRSDIVARVTTEGQIRLYSTTGGAVSIAGNSTVGQIPLSTWSAA